MKKQKTKQRPLDRLVERSSNLLGEKIVAINKKNIKTWQGVFVIAFVAGAFTMIIWASSINVKTTSKAFSVNTSQAEGKKLVKGEILLRFKPGTARENENKILNEHNAKFADEISQLKIKRILVPEDKREKIISALSHNPNVDFAESNFLAEPVAVPNDPSYPSQWHLAKIEAPAGWDISTGFESTAVAILDSGVDPTHPDLASKLLPGYNFYDNNENTTDIRGHGTSVAGAAAAITNNAIGIAGVAWQNKIMPIRIADPDGTASYYNMARGMTYAIDHGVRSINLSYAGTSSSLTLSNTIDYVMGKNGLFFAGAGNSNTDALYYPAAYPKAVAVAATTSSDTKASFSNYGTWIDISAPGASIYTTANGGGYRSASGTSFSTPITAGLAALIMSANPGLLNTQVEQIIKENADDLGTAGFDVYFGYGRINARKSLLAAISIEPPAPDTEKPFVSITSPVSGATVYGTTIVNVSANDTVGVSRVELYVDGSILATDNGSPFSFSWDTTKVADGSHELKALAYDAANNVGQSATVTVTVKNADSTAPTASITSPAGGSTISGITPVNVTASDNMGVSKVEIFANGALIGSDTSSPYSYSWDTTRVTNGSYALVAYAYDAASNRGTSNTVNVTISNISDLQNPVVIINSPANGSILPAKGTVIVSTVATDDVGVTKIEILVDNKLKTTCSQATCSYDLNTTSLKKGAHAISAKAYDASGKNGSSSINVTK